METVVSGMLTAIQSAFAAIITMVGDVVTALVTDTGALNELLVPLAIGIGIAILGFGIRTIKNVVWGA